MAAPSSPPPSASPPTRGSPSALRLASGRAVPLPLDLDSFKSTPLVFDDSPPLTLDDQHPHPPARPPRSTARSPMTPDRGGQLGASQRSASGSGAAAGGQAGGSARKDRTGAARNTEAPPTSFSSSSSSTKLPLSSSSHRLPPSQSSASLSHSARPARTPSVLGYTSSSRRNGSPTRGGGQGQGGRSDQLAPPPLTATSNGAGGAGMGSSSRFLLTVVPPSHLPHDPPHPRTGPSCSGYGPPEHFRRGILVPLYPTLSSQLAAIAREYGLPSTGGLMLYLLSTSDPYSQGPMPGAAGFSGEGGPRISEAAWSLLWAQLFAEEEEMQREMQIQQEQQMMMMREEDDDATEDDEDYIPPPPVPPLPLSHSQGRGGAVDEHGVFSDEGERVSQSSDAGASGSSVYSTDGGSKSRKSSTSTSAAHHRASSVAQSGIGRGPPPSAASLISPNGAKRFTSLPSSVSHSHLRHTSRTSLRSISHAHRPLTRSSYAAYANPPMALGGRSTSYGSYSPSMLGSSLPGYGASVVVGKVEFDIHSTARGGKWYESWVAGANPATTTSATSSSAVSPSLPYPAPNDQPWQELHLPAIVASKTSTPLVPQGLVFSAPPPPPPLEPREEEDDDFTPPSRRPSPLPPISSLDFSAPDSLASSTQSRDAPDMTGMQSAVSSFSLAALAAHVPDEPEAGRTRESLRRSTVTSEMVEAQRGLPEQKEQVEDGEAETSIVDKALLLETEDEPEKEKEKEKAPSRSSSSLPSRPVSNASSFKLGSSEKGTDDTPLMEHERESDEEEHAEEVEQPYAALSDDEGAEREDEKLSYQPLAEGEVDEGSDDDSRYGEEEPAPVSQEQQQVDPLGDVFESDEATWRSLAADDSVPRLHEREQIEMTGLGILGARVVELEGQAPEGVLERHPERETLDEQGLPPPQDDVAEVAALLGSSASTKQEQEQQRQQGPLASPIRLSSSGDAAEKTGVFPPSPAQRSSSAGVDGGNSPSASSPFSKTHSPHTSISTVQFSVRPPSTIASVSPEYLPQRRQRQGWTNVPPVFDPPMSSSPSLSSLSQAGENDSPRTSALAHLDGSDSPRRPLGGTDSQRASTIGLNQDLDDLERALAELSPRAGMSARNMRSPLSAFSAVQDEEQSVEPASQPIAPPPRTSSAAATTTVSPSLSLRERPAFRYGMLSPPAELTSPVDAGEHKPFKQEQDKQKEEEPSAAALTSAMPGYEHDSPRELAASAAPLAPAAPVVQSVPAPAATAEDATVTRTPSDPIRIPRSSSLNKSETSTSSAKPPQQQLPAQLVALPTSPMPNGSTESVETTTFSPLPLSEPPLPPSPLPYVPEEPSGPPPLPPRKDTIDGEEDASFPAPPPPRSPGLRSLRSGKWGSRGKNVEVSTKPLSPELGSGQEESGAKSPLGAFFGKSTFGKAKGFFRRGDSASPDLSNPVPLPDGIVTPPVPIEAVIPPRKDSLDIAAAPVFPSRQRRPSGSVGSQPAVNEPLPPFPPSLAANTVEANTSPRPPFLAEQSQPTESFQTAQTTLYSPPSASPAPSASPSASTAIDAVSPSLLPTAAPLSPAGGSAVEVLSSPRAYSPDPFGPSSTGSPYLLASPRSDYTPQTPRAGGSTFSTSTSSSFSSAAFPPPPSAPSQPGQQQYPASAPVTPADWRFTPGGTTRAKGKGARRRLSGDLDALLNQMNEIDFGLEEVVVTGEEEKEREEKSEEKELPTFDAAPPPTSPRVVEPEPDVGEAYDGGVVAPPSPQRQDSTPLFGSGSSHDEHEPAALEVEDNLLRVANGHNRGQDSQGRPFPLSEDLSALGNMMSGMMQSPPMSPEATTSTYPSDYPVPPPVPVVAAVSTA
ncbi:hypothetical protein JCM8547_001439 [Rhodosporidiobolus lusitaniae]